MSIKDGILYLTIVIIYILLGVIGLLLSDRVEAPALMPTEQPITYHIAMPVSHVTPTVQHTTPAMQAIAERDAKAARYNTEPPIAKHVHAVIPVEGEVLP